MSCAVDRVQPGGSFLIAWQLANKRVLVVGGGNVASGRLTTVLSADAIVTLVSPGDRLHPETAAVLMDFPQRVTYHERLFKDSDLDGHDFVLTCINDIDASRHIVDLCRARKIPVNAADIPPLCDFYFGSAIRQGPLQILISTSGNGPKLANVIRRKVEAALPSNAGRAIENVGILRKKLRARAPEVGGPVGAARMSWMSQICEEWGVDDLALLDEPMMERLLDDGWSQEPRVVPRLRIRERFSTLSRATILAQINSWRGGFSLGFVGGAVACAAVVYFRRRQ